MALFMAWQLTGENYAEQMLEVLSANEDLINTAEQDYIPRPDFRPLTKFEARGHRLGYGY